MSYVRCGTYPYVGNQATDSLYVGPTDCTRESSEYVVCTYSGVRLLPNHRISEVRSDPRGKDLLKKSKICRSCLYHTTHNKIFWYLVSDSNDNTQRCLHGPRPLPV